ncbi:MAG TPA: type II toxin-antitoxin system HicA family toxin [Solirubrobacteraceae bacterium]|nr:type II toxin-antitoxin system HicA family toxin [Solirubrobacteraceae bacterium]
MKVRDVIARLHAEGWVEVRVSGSHRQFKHPVRRGTVTVAGKRNRDLPAPILASIRRQAGWKE